jgi:ribulose-phosphate 3-epimerase
LQKNNMSHLIAPSILAANFGKLEDEINMINASVCDYLHVDVMDGVFVPNISFGQEIVKTMSQLCKKPLDVHLMIVDPDKYIEDFKKSGASIITVHAEACPHLHRTVQYIKSFDIQAGVALNPHTNILTIEDILEEIDLVCLMSVNPGFGGQKFIYRTINKIQALKKIIEEINLEVKIEIDGGVGLHNAEVLLKAGADILVAGNAIFKDKNPLNVIDSLKNLDSIKSFH